MNQFFVEEQIMAKNGAIRNSQLPKKIQISTKRKMALLFLYLYCFNLTFLPCICSKCKKFRDCRRSSSWLTFDLFKQLNMDVVETFVGKDDLLNLFKKSTCSCVYFLKDYICHHIFGFAYR